MQVTANSAVSFRADKAIKPSAKHKSTSHKDLDETSPFGRYRAMLNIDSDSVEEEDVKDDNDINEASASCYYCLNKKGTYMSPALSFRKG